MTEQKEKKQAVLRVAEAPSVTVDKVILPLVEGLRNGRFPSDVMAHDGTPYRTRQGALKGVAVLKDRGIQYLSNCPTPLPDGSCPGHVRAA